MENKSWLKINSNFLWSVSFGLLGLYMLSPHIYLGELNLFLLIIWIPLVLVIASSSYSYGEKLGLFSAIFTEDAVSYSSCSEIQRDVLLDSLHISNFGKKWYHYPNKYLTIKTRGIIVIASILIFIGALIFVAYIPKTFANASIVFIIINFSILCFGLGFKSSSSRVCAVCYNFKSNAKS